MEFVILILKNSLVSFDLQRKLSGGFKFHHPGKPKRIRIKNTHKHKKTHDHINIFSCVFNSSTVRFYYKTPKKIRVFLFVLTFLNFALVTPKMT